MNDFNRLKSFFDNDCDLTDGEILTAFIKSLEFKSQSIYEFNDSMNIEIKINIINACAKAIESLSIDNCNLSQRRLARSNLLIDIADIEVIK